MALTPSLFLVLFSSPFPALISSISLWLFLALSLRNCKSKGASAVLLPLLYHHAFSSRKKRKRRRRFCMRGRERPFSFLIFVGRARYICHQPTRVPLLRPAFFRRGGFSRTKMRSPEERDGSGGQLHYIPPAARSLSTIASHSPFPAGLALRCLMRSSGCNERHSEANGGGDWILRILPSPMSFSLRAQLLGIILFWRYLTLRYVPNRSLFGQAAVHSGSLLPPR